MSRNRNLRAALRRRVGARALGSSVTIGEETSCVPDSTAPSSHWLCTTLLNTASLPGATVALVVAPKPLGSRAELSFSAPKGRRTVTRRGPDARAVPAGFPGLPAERRDSRRGRPRMPDLLDPARRDRPGRVRPRTVRRCDPRLGPERASGQRRRTARDRPPIEDLEGETLDLRGSCPHPGPRSASSARVGAERRRAPRSRERRQHRPGAPYA